MSKTVEQSEADLELLEKEIPRIGAEASRQAYEAALKLGLSVVILEDGRIVEVFPDGRHVLLKMAEPQSAVDPSTRIILK